VNYSKSKIVQKILAKVNRELEFAETEEEIKEIMLKYGVVFDDELVLFDPRCSKILVFGALAGKEKDYKMVAKKMGIPEDRIIFESDYDKLKTYNTAKLEYSSEYSDIIFGPVPHKQVGIGDKNSFLSKVKENPSRYPRVIEATANGQLKITISNFKDLLTKTRYFERI